MTTPTPTPTTDSAMYQTMHRQPDDVRRLLSTGWDPAEAAAERLAPARRVFTVGIGTSYHAALVGAWLLRAAGSDARAISSFDFALYPASADLSPEDAVVVLAHTGVKQFSAHALARAEAVGATRISIGSLTADHAGSQQVLRTVERERSAAFTASHLTAMLVLAQIATRLGEDRGAQATTAFRNALELLPIEQFLHGPLVAVNADDLAVVVNVPGVAAERVAQITRVLDTIGARVWLVGAPVDGLEHATLFGLPTVPELLSPLLTVVPIQMLAYEMAVARGINPDLFRRDDPRYASALGLLRL